MADDEPTARLLVQATVEQLGHDCVVAEDGEQAWRMIATSDADVVVSDWLMPGLDGLQLCRRIRTHEGGTYTYLILVTSRNDRDHIRAGMEAGADDYLTKPLDPFALETRLIAAERVTSLHAELQRYQNDLSRLARTDPLTQLSNRLALNDYLAALHAQSRRYERSYSLIMGDVDTFKAYNDAYGHQAGDEVLRTVAGALTGAVRASDTVYRFGGEEFLIVLPEQTLTNAGVVAERARAAVEDLALEHRAGTPHGIVTLSLGVAAFDPGDDLTPEDVVRQADQALYEAKAGGRNRVVPAGSKPIAGERASTTVHRSPRTK